MKYYLIGLIVVFVCVSGCKKNVVKPINTIQLEDIVGTWISVDSIMGQLPDSSYDFLHDFLEIKSDSFILNDPYQFQRFGKSAFYSFYLFKNDSINLQYNGPSEVGFVNNNWRHKIKIQGDTLTIVDLKKTYPYYHFSKYIRF